MGYTKIIQYGDKTEIYNYDKPLPLRFNKRKTLSKMAIKRRKAIRELPSYFPSNKAVKRAKSNFFRLCHHNNINSNSITFLTLTFPTDYPFPTYGRIISKFFNRLRLIYDEPETNTQISYIGVPELTKKGRVHYHLLVYNLPPNIVKAERVTRNIQRLYQGGYLHASLATDTSPKIAGYMSKYMAKHFSTPGNSYKRAYNSSRNIKKIRSFGSDTLSSYSDLIFPNEKNITDSFIYEVPYMGTCVKKTYTL